jgi:hypothetical protein
MRAGPGATDVAAHVAGVGRLEKDAAQALGDVG